MRSLERLEGIRKLPKGAFLADQDILDLACYRLLVAIEAAIQICFHISAQRLHRVPAIHPGKDRVKRNSQKIYEVEEFNGLRRKGSVE